VVTTTGTITVTPNNTVTLTSAAATTSQTVCINTAITNITYATTGATGAIFAGLPAGVTGVWAANVITISGTPTASGNYNYTLILTGGCGFIITNGMIMVTPDNTIILTSGVGTDNQTVCNNTAITNITYNTTGATGVSFTGLPAGVTGTWLANVATISGTPTISGLFTYTVTLTGGCGVITTTGTIKVSSDNTIVLTSAIGTDNQIVCIGNAITTVTYTTTGATGANFTGLPTGMTVSWAANTVTISGSPTTSGVYNYVINLTGGCGTISTGGTITVMPINTVSLTSAIGTDAQTVCINTAITNITYATTGATGATVTGLPAGITGLWAANVVTISGTPTAAGPFTYTVTLTGGCGVITTTGTITVTANNTVARTSPVGTDAQTVCINTAITNITYATTGATGATVTGLPAGITGLWAANVVTISGTPTAAGPFTYTVTLTGGCGVITTTGTITVTANNTVARTSPVGTDAQTVCINTAITNITYATTGATGATVTGLPAGVTGLWAANVVTISGTPTAAGPFTYTVTLTGGCGVITTTGTITVTANNTAGAPSSTPTLCINTVLTNITHATAGATGIGAAVGLPAGVTSAWAANTITISGTPTASGVFNYTIPLTGGCGAVNATGTITVTPVNTASLTSPIGTDAQTVCINTAITNITYATTGATGATVTGLPAGVTGLWAGNVVTISGTPTAAGPFTYTVTLTGGCGVITTTGTITVTPDNTASLTSPIGTDAQTVCINTAITNITYATTGATGATVTGLPAGVTGLWAGNVVTISGTPTAAGPFTYTVTLTGGCGVITTTGTITVTPINTTSLTSPVGTDAQTVCINTAITNITYATTGATGATVTGLPAGVTGLWAANVVTISGTSTAAGPFTYTVTLTGGCGVITTTGTITVTSVNTASLTSPVGTDAQTICFNTAITNITYATTGATGATVTGLPAGVTGLWAANVVTISGTPTAAGPFTYTVTLTGGCGVITTTGTITVTPVNTASLTSPVGTDAQTLCINTAITNITYTTTGATGATVTGLPAGVMGLWAANVVTISGTPTAAGPFTYTVTLTGGCGVITTTGTITVTPDNTASLTSPIGTDAQTVCINTAITNITYATTGATGATVTGLPIGVTGLWAANVVTISGTPTAAGPFTYTVTLTGGCGVITTTGTLTVAATLPVSVVIAADANPICAGASVNFTATPTNGGTTPVYQWYNGATPVGTNSAIYSYIPANSDVITVVLTSNVTCQSGGPATSNAITMMVNPLPTVTTTQVNVACFGGTNGTATAIPAGGSGVYAYSWNTVPVQTTITATGLTAGTYIVTITDGNNCTATGSVTITEPTTTLSGSIVSQTNVSIPGGNDGSVVVSGSGGTPPYQYKLGSGVYQATGTFSSLSAVSYTVAVQDNNLCTFNVIVNITEPAATLSGSVASQTNVACFGTSTGSVIVNGAGGVPPYEYTLNGGTYQVSDTFGSLAAGTYTITIRDAVSSTFNVSVTITQSASSVGGTITSQTNVLCFGINTGSVTVAGSGGIPPYQYKLGGGSYQASGIFSTLAAGSYSVTVQDANLCTFDVSVTVTQPPTGLSGSIASQTNVSCSLSTDGSLTITGSGGILPYMYSLNVGTFQVSGIFNNLAGGNYAITVQDANLCTAAVTATIIEPEAISIDSTKVNASCPGVPDGSIALTITGGTQPYNVIWSDGILTQNRQDITGGTYSVVVTDKNGCAASLDIVVGIGGSEKCLVIPTIITPNNDGVNDTWQIKNIDLFPNAEVFIFTRWGKLVFHSKNLSANPWNGTYEGTLLPTDSYHYVLHLNDGSKPRSGVISVIR
jgi:gliding motility-associated-like protein